LLAGVRSEGLPWLIGSDLSRRMLAARYVIMQTPTKNDGKLGNW
jgi:hypothetical protein